MTGVTPKLAAGGGKPPMRVFIQDHCPVLELGPHDETIHKVDEYIAVEDLLTLTDIYEKVLDSYFSA